MNDDCLKLTTYSSERHRTDHGLVADAVLDLYGRHEVATSILLRGAGGFGPRHRLRTDRLLSLAEDLPIVSIAVDDRRRIEAILDDVRAVTRNGLVTVERARMLTDDIGPALLPGDLAESAKLTVYLGRQEQVRGAPAFLAVCDLLHRRGLAGATVLLGVDGTAHGRRQRARFLGRNADVPMMIVAVGDGNRIARVLPELGSLLRRPLLTLERVRICKRDGQRLARPRVPPVADGGGRAVRQKLTVYTSEQSRDQGTPVHIALVRALRAGRASGATVLRGMWGFHGDHAPHGDRLLALRRRVPVVTIVIDSPERIADWFAIIDALTQERGLVTCETIPAIAAFDEAGGGICSAAR